MAPNSTTGLLWVATLCVTFVVTLAKTPYLEDKFEIDQALGAAFNKMVLHNETGKLYVGAVNRLYIFDKDLTDIQTLQTGPKMDNPDCLPKVNSDFECDKPLKETAVYTKALLIDYDNEVLIACSNLYQGVCGKYNLTSLQKILPADKSNRFPFQPMVANNDSATTVLFIALGPKEPQSQHQRNALYCGVSYTINGSYREKIPSMATRSLSDFSLVYKETFVKTQTMIESTLRESFHVYFIYGFGSEKFSYMVTVQKQSPNTENYVTKMLRVCQNDTSYFSYAEVYLQCYHEGVMYNLSQAAYTGKAGIHLAKALEIPTTEDVLYVVFASGSTSPGSPGSKSAVCVYPLREIRAVFSKNIQECFEGVGNTGPNHIITPQRCSKTNTLVVDDNYCGDHRVNYPIDGTIPITAEAAVTFNKTASAITVSVNSGNTVAFVGTTSGHVIKIALEAQDYGIAYEDVAVAEGQKINSDMFVDTQKQSLYVMTDWKLMKLKLYECSQYTTCDACLGASDPYCGWCSLENKCSLRMECTEFDQDLRWLPYNSESCTMISEVIPDKIQKGDRLVKHLQLNVSSLPRFQDKYQCRFRGYGMDILTTDMKLAHNTNNIIMCETPEPNQLPPIPTGEDHIVMKLTVQIGNRDFVSTQFTIFDCDVHMSCTECSLTDFPCTWCINNHLCRYNTSESCTKNELVHGKIPTKHQKVQMSVLGSNLRVSLMKGRSLFRPV